MKSTKKQSPAKEAEVLDRATQNLLTALKKEMIQNEGRIDRDKLLKDGYSPRLLDRLEES